jgi:branched-chain amino acid transport system permease protein
MNKLFQRTSTLVSVIILCLLAFLPFVAHLINEPYYIALLARVLIYAIAACALNIAVGFCGLVSLGHALFFGIGAYAVALPSFYGIDNGLTHLVIALSVSGLIALFTGILCLRTQGIGFIMITLAFAQMGYFLFVSMKHYGGDDGLAIYETSRLMGFDLGNESTLYVFAFSILVVLIAWLSRMRQSPFGMILRGAKQNRKRISSIGFSVTNYQLTAYVISAMICAVAGLLMANLNAYASPNLLSWTLSGELLVIIVLGGVGTLFGPLLGALSFLMLEEVLAMLTQHWMALLGLILLIVALLDRTGIIGLLDRYNLKIFSTFRTTKAPLKNDSKLEDIS